MKCFKSAAGWAIISAALLIIVGCSLLGGGLSKEDKRSELVTKAIVATGTVRLIDGDLSKKERIIDVAETIKQYVKKNPEGRAADVGELLNDNIPWEKLTVEENYLVTSLLSVVQTDIESRIREGVVSADLMLRVRTIVKWVLNAAEGADAKGLDESVSTSWRALPTRYQLSPAA